MPVGCKAWEEDMGVPGNSRKKQDSLFCKVAYMIDLQQEQLVMFVGRQMQPQEKKP